MKNIVQIKVFSRKLLQSLVIPSKMFKENKKKTKSKKKKKIINNLIGKNNTIIELPLSYFDDDLKDIMKYLEFCKGKYYRIVHISNLKILSIPDFQ